MPATTATAFGFDSWGCVSGVPQVYGLELAQGTVNRTSDSVALLDLQGVQGEAGTESTVFVAMPPGTPAIKTILLNGASVTGYTSNAFRDVPTVSFTVEWAGDRFSRNQQIGTTDGFTGGSKCLKCTSSPSLPSFLPSCSWPPQRHATASVFAKRPQPLSQSSSPFWLLICSRVSPSLHPKAGQANSRCQSRC